MKELIIDYTTWRCGHYSGTPENRLGKGDTKLLNSEGFKCCLGFFSLQLNSSLSENDIDDLGEPNDVRLPIPGLSCGLPNSDHINNTKLSIEAININDCVNTTVAEKVHKLKTLFHGHGYNIKVVNAPENITSQL